MQIHVKAKCIHLGEKVSYINMPDRVIYMESNFANSFWSHYSRAKQLGYLSTMLKVTWVTQNS